MFRRSRRRKADGIDRDQHDELAAAKDKIPRQFHGALEHAPPEVLDVLKALGVSPDATVNIEVDEITISDSRSGNPEALRVDPTTLTGDTSSLEGLVSEALAAAGLANAGVSIEGLEGVEITTDDLGDASMATSVSVTGGSPRTFDIRFARSEYRPGDVVEGAVVAKESTKGSGVELALGFCEESPHYSEHTVYDTAEQIHKGRAHVGTEIPFSFRLPPDASPNWDPGGLVATRAAGGTTQGPVSLSRIQLSGLGQLYWGIVVTALRRGMVGHDVEYHPIPLDGAVRWTGPPPPELPDIDQRVKGIDVEPMLSQRAPRRGEQITVDLHNARPAADTPLSVGLVGEIHSDRFVEESTDFIDKSTAFNDTRHRRITSVVTAHEEWQTIDPTLQIQQLRFEIPADAPFSHGPPPGRSRNRRNASTRSGRNALAVSWRVVVRSETGRRSPAECSAVIWVRP
jgi:hypothetical protein